MLDIHYIRENPDKVKASAAAKGVEINIDALLEADKLRRELIAQSEKLKHQYKHATNLVSWVWKIRNSIAHGQEIQMSDTELRDKLQGAYESILSVFEDPDMKKTWEKKVAPLLSGTLDVEAAVELAALVFGGSLQAIREKPKDLELSRAQIENSIKQRMLEIPNVAQGDVPVGGGDKNKVLREGGEEREFDFEPRAHWDIGKELGILDVELAAKLAGSNFVLFRGAGAKLVRALMNFMLDAHAANGYVEVWPPVLANRKIMTGTGQLPKFEEDMYRFEKDDMFLVPTAEVPLTALHAGEILTFTDLPLGYCAYTPCFRREAGAYGRETRGLLRVHQFDKVELLKFTTEEQSGEETEKLLADAEAIIQKLGLRYRVQLLATGEMSFAASRTYDIDIWSPGVKRWLEVSSVSNFESFQARRLSIRYRDENRKVKFCHTLNGSGVAFARLIACILETYQQEDGSVEIPEKLRSYFGTDRIEKA